MEKEWQQFTRTGRVEDYLRYTKACYEKMAGNKQEMKERQDCDEDKSDTYRDCVISSTHRGL